jgi:hypothetical protein
MLAATLTLWGMFSLWLMGPRMGIPPLLVRTAGALLAAELVALLAWSYGSEGCDEPECAPLARSIGLAARTDIPILAAALVLVAAVGRVRVRR